MLIAPYWSMFHLYAQLKVSLVYLSIFLVLAAFSTSSSASCLHPLPNLSPPSSVYPAFSVSLHVFSIALFSFSHPALPFLPPLSRSYRRIALVDVVVCFRSRVDEEGVLGCGVDLFSALILIGAACSWLTGPAWRNQILSSTFTFLIPFPTTLNPQYELTQMQNTQRIPAYIKFLILYHVVSVYCRIVAQVWWH